MSNLQYKLSDFKQDQINRDIEPVSFLKLLKSKWDRIHREPNVFRYKINNLQKKLVDEKYILILNTDRGTNRRIPEHITNIRQPFDDNRFNFIKVVPEEIMFSIESEGEDHALLVNVSPMSQYHSLLCPSIKKKLPQVVTADGLLLAINILFVAQDSELKIVFNSLCGLASVNHLHFHLFIDKHTWPVELVKWKQIKGGLHCLQDYPVPAFCFEVQNDTAQANVAEVYRLIQYFLDNSIAHNIAITRRKENVSVYIWPRKSVAGVKNIGDMNVAACELSGWITVYSTEAFQRLQTEDLEKELMNWKIDDFESLCKEVELLCSVVL